jgi:hypothetical protein
MIILITILAWIALSLFGWSLLRVAAQADRKERAQSMKPWAHDAIVSSEDARLCSPIDVVSARRSHARGVEQTRARVRAGAGGW